MKRKLVRRSEKSVEELILEYRSVLEEYDHARILKQKEEDKIWHFISASFDPNSVLYMTDQLTPRLRSLIDYVDWIRADLHELREMIIQKRGYNLFTLFARDFVFEG